MCAEPADWPRSNRMCGFLAPPSTSHEQLSPELEAFLANGEPPVFMGFGSLMPTDPSSLKLTVETMKEAARQAGCRVIIQAAAPAEPGDRCIIAGRTPHAELFPRCAAVVHHCGAGTTHTTLRAGVPSVGVPHVSDQFGWAAELRRLGVAPAPIGRRSLTASKLAKHLKEVLDNPGMRTRAIAIADRMKDDDGPATAAVMIEEAAAAFANGCAAPKNV
jgi:UDP:flavonoid glycosyltransferase YjiC (YdhE family)